MYLFHVVRDRNEGGKMKNGTYDSLINDLPVISITHANRKKIFTIE